MRVRDLPTTPRRNSVERGTPTRNNHSGKGNQPTCIAFFNRVIVQKAMLVMSQHPPECSVHQKGIANLGVSVRLSIRTRPEANQRNEITLWLSPKTLDYTPTEDNTTWLKFIAKGGFLYKVSANPEKINSPRDHGPSDLPLAASTPEADFSSCLSREVQCFSRTLSDHHIF